MTTKSGTANDAGYRGDDAFVRLFLENRGRLEAVMFRRTGCRAAAADLVQELFLRLWNRRANLQDAGEGYLFRSACNLAIDHRRTENARAALDQRAAPSQLHAEPVPTDAAPAAKAELAAVDDALRRLPDRTRRAFWLNRMEGRSYDAIARDLGVSVSTVEKDMMRALAACRAAVAAAACLIATAGLAVWFSIAPPKAVDKLLADHATAIGERRMLTLADGSTMILDADSAADVVMDNGRREVVLRRGRAFFDVAKTGAPFIVKAAQGEIRVVGTRFEVARFGDCAAVVTVEEGAVSVTPPTGDPQALTPGTRLRFNGKNAKPPEAAERSVAAWRQGRLSFDDAPVREIVEEINRYHPARIVLLSNEAGKRRLSGSLPADDPAAALAGLADALGLARVDLAGQVILLK